MQLDNKIGPEKPGGDKTNSVSSFAFVILEAVKLFLTFLNEKKVDYKTVNRVCKRCQNIFYWVKKKTCLGVLE